jgi:NAD+ synthase/NAD+ synthase (glutamine-hydrolysing)
MKIALAQINTTVGDFNGNREKILGFARRAHDRGADLVLFPELAVCGYPPRDLVEKKHFVDRCEAELLCLAEALPPLAALIGSVRWSHAPQGKPVADSAVLIREGKIVAGYDKMLLPFYDVFDESRYFEPGKSIAVYELQNVRLGLTVCEDVWNDKNFWKQQRYTRDPVEETVRAGAQVLLNIASSPYSSGKIDLRRSMLAAIARQQRLPVAYVNQVGGNDSLIFDGSSMAFDASGELRARAKSFEEDLVLFDATEGCGEIQPAPASVIEAVYQALLLGLRDYVHKCGFQRVIVGLSGGIDSSLVATLAADALGPDAVYGVSMPGPYSSPGSLADAQQLASNLKIDYRVIPITPMYDAYQAMLVPSFQALPADATEENIQARVRGTVLMALSNKFGALVLSTGNKSELAVGYCTLYGDMAGGLAVIADVHKTIVYELARYINRAAIRIPQASIDKPPSAELRPNQTDQDTLPPYDVLDTVLKSCVEENLSPVEISRKHGLPLPLVRDIARRVTTAEYKRQQAAPTLKVTEKAFGIGRRLPIANKFFE